MVRMRIVIPLLVLLLAATPSEAATRNFGVSGFDRVRIEGPYRVTLTTGIAPFARAIGSASALDGLAMDVQGRTLVVRPRRSTASGYLSESPGTVDIVIGTHELSAAWLNGAGSLAIDRVRGLMFDLSVQGSGLASIGEVAVDQLKVGLGGSGSARISGAALKLTTIMRGMATLDAGELAVKDLVLGAEGPATVRLNVTGTAQVDARGTAAVTFTGGPRCETRVAGSASVSGCR
jgi:hypothetical protein